MQAIDLSTVEISFFERRTGESWTTSAASWSAHASLDLALITLAEDPRGFMAVGTLPAATAQSDSLRAGMLLQMGGFGEDEDGASGHRRFSVERVISIESDYITVSASGLGGACGGDSGGPALTRGNDGEVWIAGILDNGSASCFGEDNYTRVALAEDWLIAQLGSVERHKPAGASHTALPEQGRCYDAGIAVWSEQGQLRSQSCDVGHACGWDARSLGFRCIRAGDGSCGAVTDLGECRGESVWQCVDGTLLESPCDTCGWRCEHSPRTGAAVCLEF
jgi:hypothetical protein